MAYEIGEQLGLAVPRLDHLSHRRRHRHGRHVEGVRGDGAHRLDATPARPRWSRCRPSTARRSCARSSRAPSGRRCGRTRARVADGLRVPKAVGDFLVLRAVRESGGTALAVTRRRHGGRDARARRAKGISAAPEGGAALARASRSCSVPAAIEPRRHRRALQHRRRAEVSRRPGLTLWRGSWDGATSPRSSIPERNPHRARRADHVEVERHVARRPDHAARAAPRRCRADGTRPCGRTAPSARARRRARRTASRAGDRSWSARRRAAGGRGRPMRASLPGQRLELRGHPAPPMPPSRSAYSPLACLAAATPTRRPASRPSATTTMLKRAPRRRGADPLRRPSRGRTGSPESG